MKKTVILAILFITTFQTHKIKPDNYNDGIICSFTSQIEDDFYNKGKIYASTISIKGKVRNYKNGNISAKKNLDINLFKATVNEEKDENASAVIKRPNGYINIFLPDVKTKILHDIEENFDKIEHDDSDEITYTFGPKLWIKFSKDNHLKIIDGVIYILKEYSPKKEQELINLKNTKEEKNSDKEEAQKTSDNPFFERVKEGFFKLTKKLSGFLWIIDKEEFIDLEDKKYKVIKPNLIVLHDLAEIIDLENEGNIAISGVKLEIN